jgi:hypothetical protein
MATVNKDFKIKSGLIVEGTNATVNGNQILTETASDQYILSLIGGETLVKSVSDEFIVDGSGELSLDRSTVDAYYDSNGSAQGAYNNAVTYVDGEITTALQTAQGYADSAEADAILSAQQYTDAEVADEVIARDAAILLAKQDAISDAATYTDGEISTEITNRNSAIASAKQEAIDTAANTAASLANTAESNANSYTDDEIAAEVTRSNNYADAAAQTAEDNAKTYADGLSSGLNWKQAVNLLYDAAIPVLSGSGATQLVVDGHEALGDADSGYRLLLAGGTSSDGIYVYNSTGGSWTLTRTEDADTAAELIGAAVFVMEGTNYASTAWVQADHYLTDFTGQNWTQFSGQGTYLAGNGLSLDGTTFSIDTAVTATKVYADDAADAAETAANSYTDGRETAITTAYQNYADQAEADAVSTANAYTDGRETAITSAYETYANGVALTAEQNSNTYADGLVADEVTDRNNAINNAVNALTTDDIEEGVNNQYFLDSRAKTSAADLLTGATLSNITITGNGSGLTITAENGVSQSTTDDLTEGDNNLYFTDERAIDAVSNADIYPNAVIVDNVAKQVASQITAATAGIQIGHAFAKADYRSAEFLVKVAYGNHTEISKVLLTLDVNDNIAITEYGVVGTNGSASTISADISGTDVRLLVTTANNNSTVTVMGTLLI